jgi:hypothetical protein
MKAKSLMETKRHTKPKTLKKAKSLMETRDMETNEKQNPKVLNPIIGPKIGF